MRGPAVPVGLDSRGLYQAVNAARRNPKAGLRFTAFVIPASSASVEREDPWTPS